MTVRYYASTDASAPSLQGIVGGVYSSGWADGSLLNLLDKCLVAGYGSRTAAGWSIPYTGTSKGVFRPGSGTRFYYRFLDDGSATAGARECIVRGYEAMSDVDTGTGVGATGFPTGANRYVRKSDTADSTARVWEMYADERTAILMINYAGTTYEGYYFGDFYSYLTTDAYNAALIARVTSATADSSSNVSFLDQTNQTHAADSRVVVARNGAQAFANQTVMLTGSPWMPAAAAATNWAGAPSSNFAIPNAYNNKIFMGRQYLVDPALTAAEYVRGYLRGLWLPVGLGNAPFGYTFVGSGALAGKSFRISPLRGAANASSKFCFETSNTWDTN